MLQALQEHLAQLEPLVLAQAAQQALLALPASQEHLVLLAPRVQQAFLELLELLARRVLRELALQALLAFKGPLE